MGLEMRASAEEQTLAVSLSGELTRVDCPRFKEWVLEQVEGHQPVAVEVDCSHLSYIDSAGLGSLIYFQKLVTERQASLRLVNISGWLQKFLNVTGLERTFTGGASTRVETQE